jgi:UDP-N-acetyl-D-mannosaminuronate dehydrogenase
LNRHKQALNGSRLLLLGLTYKPNTSDMRESPAFAVANRLVRLGAEVRYVDDHVPELDRTGPHAAAGLQRVALSEEELVAANAVVVLTDHDDVDYEFVAQHSKYILDTRHRCRGDVVEYL